MIFLLRNQIENDGVGLAYLYQRVANPKEHGILIFFPCRVSYTDFIIPHRPSTQSRRAASAALVPQVVIGVRSKLRDLSPARIELQR